MKVENDESMTQQLTTPSLVAVAERGPEGIRRVGRRAPVEDDRPLRRLYLLRDVLPAAEGRHRHRVRHRRDVLPRPLARRHRRRPRVVRVGLDRQLELAAVVPECDSKCDVDCANLEKSLCIDSYNIGYQYHLHLTPELG